MQSMIAHYLLSGVMSYMDPRSHHKIAESLWGLYMSVTHNNKERIQEERNENDINSNPNNSPDNIYAGNSCNSNTFLKCTHR